MGIQDDIFDIEDTLKDKPESSAFENIVKYIARLENENEALGKFYYSCHELKTAIANIEKKK